MCPIFKSGDKSSVKNYRPIALLSNFSKLFETIFSNVIYSHVINYIVPQQHGFVKGKSTTTNLYEFTQFVSSALDNNFQVDVIYTDLTKAFDRVNHCVLLKKLEMFGFCNDLLLLLRSMIIGRKQYVEYGGCKSFEIEVNSGVAQGSNLGPLLFTIFFNDVVTNLQTKSFIYADDLKIVNIIKSVHDCLKLQSSLDSFITWCHNNKFDVNIDKCKIMRITRKVDKLNFYYNINGLPLQVCNEFKDLGVIFDSALSFVPHIEYIVNSSLKNLGFIFRNGADFKDTLYLVLNFCFIR